MTCDAEEPASSLKFFSLSRSDVELAWLGYFSHFFPIFHSFTRFTRNKNSSKRGGVGETTNHHPVGWLSAFETTPPRTSFPPFVEELAMELFSTEAQGALPFPIQAQAWPCALAGFDVIAVAPTGLVFFFFWIFWGGGLGGSFIWGGGSDSWVFGGWFVGWDKDT